MPNIVPTPHIEALLNVASIEAYTHLKPTPNSNRWERCNVTQTDLSRLQRQRIAKPLFCAIPGASFCQRSQGAPACAGDDAQFHRTAFGGRNLRTSQIETSGHYRCNPLREITSRSPVVLARPLLKGSHSCHFRVGLLYLGLNGRILVNERLLPPTVRPRPR